jgi:hypothetical protein
MYVWGEHKIFFKIVEAIVLMREETTSYHNPVGKLGDWVIPRYHNQNKIHYEKSSN